MRSKIIQSLMWTPKNQRRRASRDSNPETDSDGRMSSGGDSSSVCSSTDNSVSGGVPAAAAAGGDKVYTANLPVLPGGPLYALRGQRRTTQVFRKCALILSGRKRTDDEDSDDGEIPVLIRLDLERVGDDEIGVTVALDLRHSYFHAASVKLHGGSYFANCGSGSSSTSDEHAFKMRLAGGAGEESSLSDLTDCSKSSHAQCSFNDACMLELSVRIREESVSVVPAAVLGDRLAGKVAEMYREGARGADVVIVCRGRRMPFYKMVLCAYSDVMETMLERGGGGGRFVEGRSGTIEVKDASPEAVAAFLRVLATGTLEKNEYRRLALDLYALADKYNVEDLRAACEWESAEAASACALTEDVLRYLVAAHLHGSAVIRKAALEKLASGPRPGAFWELTGPTETEAWMALEEAHPQLAKMARQVL